MPCKIEGVRFDTADAARKTRIATLAAEGNEHKKLELEVYLHNDEDFKQFVYSQTGVIDFNNITDNELVLLINKHYFNNNPSADNILNKYAEYDFTELFTSTSAREIARAHFADILIRNFRLYTDKEGNKEVTKIKALTATKDEILQIVKTRAEKIIDELRTSRIDKDIELVKLFDEVYKPYVEITNKIKNLNNDIKKASNDDDSKKAAKKAMHDYIVEISNKNGLTNIKGPKDFLDYYRDTLYPAIYVAIKTKGHKQDLNYLTLAGHVKGDVVDWFRKTATLQKLRDVANAFKDIDLDAIDEFEMSELFDEGEEIDLSSRAWVDYADRYKDYLASLDSETINFLNTIQKTNKYNDEVDENNQDYTLEDELGVTTTIGAPFLVAQIQNFGNFSSPQAFINSLKKAGKNIPELSSFGVIVYRMENDVQFLNKMFHELARPRISKIILSRKELAGSFAMDESNKNSNPLSCIYFQCLENAKSYTFDFNKEDFDIFTREMSVLNNAMNNNAPDNVIKEITERNLIRIIRKMFPNLTTDMLLRAIYKNKDNANKFNVAFQAVLRSIDEISYKRWKLNKFEEEHKNSINALISIEKEYSSLNDTCYTLALLLADKIPVATKYQSPNAEGNMSSDVYPNSFLTRFIQQLEYSDTKDDGSIDKIGARLLGNFLSKSKNSFYNPLISGIYDENGVLINDEYSIFLKDNNNLILNPKTADGLFSISLFDGIADRSINMSSLYKNMTKGDYVMSMLHAFRSPKGKYGEKLAHNKRICGIMLQIPSDAPKNFMLILNRILSENCFTYNINIEDKIKELINDNNIIQTDVEDVAFNKQFGIESINIEGEYKSINAKQFTDLLYDNNSLPEGQYSYTTQNGNIIRIDVMKDENGNTDYINLSQTVEDESEGTYDSIDDVVAELIKEREYETADASQMNINKNSQLYRAFRQLFVGELHNLVDSLNAVTYNKSTKEDKGAYGYRVFRESTNGLFDQFHYKKTMFDENGRLTGNAFSLNKLFKINGIDVNSEFIEQFLYGGATPAIIKKNGEYCLNSESPLFTSNYELNEAAINDYIDTTVTNWMSNYYKECIDRFAEYSIINNGEFSRNEMIDCFMNNTIAYMSMDDIFGGNSKFYKDARDFLKRAKEMQAAGKAFAGYNFDDEIGGALKAYTLNGVPQNIQLGETTIDVKNGFRAITIANTLKSSDNEVVLRRRIEAAMEKRTNLSPGVRAAIVEALMKPFGHYKKGEEEKVGKTKTNDAQSYITIEEFIRRLWLKGSLKNYDNTLIEKLLDPDADLTTLNSAEIRDFIQLQKNFYFDIQFDEKTGIPYPRQIKNSEFVLIPALLPKDSDLYALYKMMKENNIDQVNTVETTKAAKKNVLTFWDNEGNINPNFDDELNQVVPETGEKVDVYENYYYKYLYEQQEVSSHLKDKANKFGLQISKKIVDNLSTGSEKTKKAIDSYFNAYVSNIKNSCEILFDNMGWYRHSDGTLRNKSNDAPVSDFTEFYNKARSEAQRLGMDSQFIEYFTLDEFGSPMMPNFFNNVQQKCEQIAESIFNKAIARQELPGWHGAQLTNVGYTRKLKYHPDIYRLKKELTEDEIKDLKYEIEFKEFDKLSDEDKLKYELHEEGYAEIAIPRWSNLIPKPEVSDKELKAAIKKQGIDENDKTAVLKLKNELYKKRQEEIIKQIEKEGLDIQIGYRIPTEGKQSVSVLKVVEILDDTYDSTIMVPDEWVTQTGSDFDIDSIYGITFPMYATYDRKGRKILKKIKGFDEETASDDEIKLFNTEEARMNRYINYIKERSKESIKRDPITGEVKKDIKSQANAEVRASLNEEQDKAFRALPLQVIQKFAGTKGKTGWDAKHAAKNKKDKAKYIEDRINELYEWVDAYERAGANVEAELVKTYIDTYIASTNVQSDEYVALYKEVINEKFNEEAKKRLDTAFQKAKDAAARGKLISYEDFCKLSSIDQQTKKQRDSIILQSIIDVLNDETSLEEQMTVSGFVDLISARDKIRTLTKESEISTSTYNPFDQAQFREDAMSGAELKALSVNRDTALSIFNKIKASLSKEAAIKVIYTRNKYDEFRQYDFDSIQHSYGKNATVNGDRIEVIHDKLGWSEDNRNIVGKLITTYGSQTTAHILDAIKEGSLTNENKYTFGVFKLMLDLGVDYYTAEMFLASAGVTSIVNAYNRSNSMFINSNANPINIALRELAQDINLNIGTRKEPKYVTDNTPIIIIRNALHSRFGISIIEKVAIDNNKLEQELSGNLDDEEFYKSKFETILAFEHMKNTINSVEKVIMCLGSDKNAAPKTIHMARKLLENIWQYGYDVDEVSKIITTEKVSEDDEIISIIDKVSYIDRNDPNDENTIFVFGSNPKGINGKGAALQAVEDYGISKSEIMDNTISENGRCYGITTVISPGVKRSISKKDITENIKRMLEYAREHTDKKFYIAYNNLEKASLNGYTGYEMIDMFKRALREYPDVADRIVFNKAWKAEMLNKASVLESIYPGLPKYDKDLLNNVEDVYKNLDVSRSSYPSLCAMVKYGTVSAVTINTKLFPLEQHFVILRKRAVEQILNKTLNDEEYLKLNKYIVATGFRQLPILYNPVTINDNGNYEILPVEEQDNNYYLEEELRIIGAKGTINTYITISDFNNPTEDDIIAFRKLTPAQKVKWMQNFLGDGAGIFNRYRTQLNEGFEKYKRTINEHRIIFEDDSIDKEEVYREFIQQYSKGNKLVKLALLDLVKYSFVKEGFDFKRNYVTKSIPNIILRTDINEGGTNIKSDMEQVIRDIDYDFIFNFIRANSDIVGKLTLSKQKCVRTKTSKKGTVENFVEFEDGHIEIKNPNLISMFSKYSNGLEGFVNLRYFSYLEANKKQNDTSEFDNLSSELGFSWDEYGVEYGNDEEEENEEIEESYETFNDNDINTKNKLFYIINSGDNTVLYLIPVNKLKTHETRDTSIYTDMNTELDFNYLVSKIINKLDNVSEIVNMSKLPKTEDGKITEFKSTYASEVSDINNAFSSLYDYIKDVKAKETSAENIKHILKNMNEVYSNPEVEHYIFHANNSEINKMFNEYDEVYQELEDIGSVRITKLNDDISKAIVRIINNLIDSKSGFNKTRIEDVKLPILEKAIEEYNKNNSLQIDINTYGDIIYELASYNISNPTLFISEKFNSNERYSTSRYIEEDIEVSEIVSDIESIVGRKENPLLSIMGNAIEDINKKSKDSDNILAKESIKQLRIQHVDIHDNDSLYENMRNLISITSSYYSKRVQQLLDRMNHIPVGRGVAYRINDPELYENLKTNPNREEIVSMIQKTILESKNFGKNIQDIKNIDTEGMSADERRNIELIKSSIYDLDRAVEELINAKDTGAFDMYYNIYIANYSNNPLVISSIMNLTEVFGDTCLSDNLFSDIAELDHAQIQMINKLVRNKMEEARISAIRDINEFNKEWKKLIDKVPDLKKLIKNGTIHQRYTNKFIEDKKRFAFELDMIAHTNGLGKYSVEYQNKLLEYNEWEAKYTEQKIVKDFYVQKNNIMRKVLTIAPEQYVEYIKINDELYEMSKKSNLNPAQEARKQHLINEFDRISNFINGLEIDDRIDPETYSISELKATYGEEFDTFTNHIDDKWFTVQKTINDLIALRANYYKKEPIDGWKDTVIANIEIINEYDRLHSNESLRAKLNNKEYRIAYEWLQTNTIQYSRHEDDVFIKTGLITPYQQTIKYLQDKGLLDENRKIKYNELTEEDIDKIREFNNAPFSSDPSIKVGDKIMIKNGKRDVPIYTDEFYKQAFGEEEYEKNEEKLELIKEYNQLISKGIDNTSGYINVNQLFTALTRDELDRLADILLELRQIKTERDIFDLELMKLNVNFKTNDVVFLQNQNEFASWLSSNGIVSAVEVSEWNDLFNAIFAETNKNGEIIRHEEGLLAGQVKASSLIYGYIEPSDFAGPIDLLIDHEATERRKNYDTWYTTEIIPEYYEARQKAKNDNKEDEWFAKNHVYNPYLHRFVPINIYTKRRLNPNYNGSSTMLKPKLGVYDKTTGVVYSPSKTNIFSKIDDSKKNVNYNEDGNNYAKIPEDNKYKNVELTDDEQKLVDLITKYAQKYAVTEKAKRIVEKGGVPQSHRVDHNFGWAMNQIFGTFGLNLHKGNSMEKHKIDYNDDVIPPPPMLDDLKTKGLKKRLDVPRRALFSNEEDYNNVYIDVMKKNKEIDEYNEKLREAAQNDDIKSIMESYIEQSAKYNQQQALRNEIYLLKDYIQNHDAYKLSYFSDVVEDKNRSTIQEKKYLNAKQKRTLEVLDTFAHRLLFDEYKLDQMNVVFGNMLQSVSSARNMAFNVSSGLANVFTGRANMLSEYIGEDYFSKKDAKHADVLYATNVLSIISSWGKKQTNNEIAAIIKLFNPLESDNILSIDTSNAGEWAKKINQAMYSPQNMGEHMMHSKVLLATLLSNRVYKDPVTNEYKVGSFGEYANDISYVTLASVVKDNETLFRAYQLYLLDTKYDKNKLHKIASLRENFVENFIKEHLSAYPKLKEQYDKKLEELTKNLKEQFEENDTVFSQLELKDGISTIKTGSHLNDAHIAQLSTKVKSINNRIHGVYDKLGAANIEKHWFGSLIMQFHKHIYPGLMRRFRRHGYFNESRGTYEKGSYISMYDYATKEFKNFKQQVKDRQGGDTIIEDDDISFIQAIYTIGDCLKRTMINLKMNWKYLPQWERQNIKKGCADGIFMSLAIAMSFILYLIWDDDDFKENVWAANLLYLSDKFYAENALYTPWGFMVEIDNLEKSPVAALSSIKDAYKIYQNVTDCMFDPNYEETFKSGPYSGENKLQSLISKQTPVYRQLYMIQHRTKSQNYYRIGDKNENMKFAKMLAELFN